MGEEPFFIDKLTELLLNVVLTETERDFNQLVFYGLDADASAVVDAARRFPMMAEHQLIVVREAQLMKNIETLSNYVRTPLDSTILVLCYKYKTLDKRKTLASLIEKNGILFESKKIPEYKMPAYIAEHLKASGMQIDSKAAQMLSDCLGNDLSRLEKELDKLSIIMAENGLKCITPELVEVNVGISKEYNNFELLKAIIQRDILKSNRIIQYFAQNPKKNPIQITLAVLFNYFSNLMICFYCKDKSEKGLMQALGLRNAFQIKDYQLGLKSFPPMKVFNLIGDIRTADARSKGVENVSDSQEEIMEELLYRILH